jgi:hypothetical protein
MKQYGGEIVGSEVRRVPSAFVPTEDINEEA